jgi:hypothetical protein
VLKDYDCAFHSSEFRSIAASINKLLGPESIEFGMVFLAPNEHHPETGQVTLCYVVRKQITPAKADLLNNFFRA